MKDFVVNTAWFDRTIDERLPCGCCAYIDDEPPTSFKPHRDQACPIAQIDRLRTQSVNIRARRAMYEKRNELWYLAHPLLPRTELAYDPSGDTLPLLATSGRRLA